MSLLREINLFYVRGLRMTLRNPVFIVMGVISPLMYLFLFAPLLKNLAFSRGFPTDNVLDTFVPGMLVMVSVFGGLFSGFGLIDDLRSGVIERFRVTPTSRFALLAGPVLLNITTMLCQVILFIGFALPMGLHLHIGGTLLLLVLLSSVTALSTSFSYAIGLIVKSEDALAPVVQGVNLPVLLLSGMLLPMSLAPRWLQIVAHFNPIYYVVESARFLIAGAVDNAMVFYAIAIMLIATSSAMAWATGVFRKLA